MLRGRLQQLPGVKVVLVNEPLLFPQLESLPLCEEQPCVLGIVCRKVREGE